MKVLQSIVLAMLCGMAACSSSAQEHVELSTFQTSVRGLLFKDILTEAYQRIGMTINVTPYPARRGLSLANDGILDGEAGRLEQIHPQFPNLVMIPVPIFLNRTVAFTKDPDMQITAWDDMRPYHVTTMLGLKYTESKLEGFEHVEFVGTIQQAFRMLELGRTDVVVFALLDGLNVINELSLQGVVPNVFEHIPSYHFLHKKHTAIVPAITKALQEMEREGRLQAVATEYRKRLEEGEFLGLQQ
jgi:polar amino acid transport system substrate-binding protein